MLQEVSIEIIRKCPNNCVHCSSMSNMSCNEAMPFESFKSVVLDAAQLGAKTICLSGGEPFLHKKIAEMTSFVHSCNLNCYIYTSGITVDNFGVPTAISKNVFAEIAKSTSKIIFNFEAASEEIYSKIMGTTGCFDLLKESILNAVSMDICSEAHFVPMQINKQEVTKVISLCQDLGISKISFLRLVPHGRAEINKTQLLLSDEDLDAIKEELDQLQSESSISIRIGVPLSLDSSCHKCEAANGKLNIKYDGNVFPCEVFKNHHMGHFLGDLSPDSIYESSLFDIYQNSEYLQRVRAYSLKFGNCNLSETCVGQYLIKTEMENKTNEQSR